VSVVRSKPFCNEWMSEHTYEILANVNGKKLGGKRRKTTSVTPNKKSGDEGTNKRKKGRKKNEVQIGERRRYLAESRQIDTEKKARENKLTTEEINRIKIGLTFTLCFA